MVQPEPVGPAQGARPERREGPRPRTRGGRVRIAGASGPGVTREIVVRGTGEGSAIGSRQASTSRRSPTPPRATSPMVEEDTTTESANVQSSSANASEEETAVKTATESAEETSTSGTQSEAATDSEGGNESIRQSFGTSHQPTSTQVATTTIQSHVLRQDIEEAVVDLAVQLHTPPSHSSISQQMVVSASHGDIAQQLPVSHLENSGIETREHQPPFSTSFGAQSLEPFDIISPIPRTRVTFSATAEGLRGSAGTPIVTPTSEVSNFAVATLTGSLSDPGVTPTEFVSREYMDGTLKVVQTMMKEEVDSLKRMIKGKGPATEPEPLPPTPPPFIPATEMSIEDLKSILLAKLLAQSQTEPSRDADLLSLLRA
ncbi:hypothetical protein L6452_40830 [Arctium lappa]|uniref:Uncharacterized protein n=1 Tax=Arctium lappa TaxID=4217 RepID=A0ACB8XMZ3_ARCLA|nr:hypothetical protein L6452_40830 [Arctium lappa]